MPRYEHSDLAFEAPDGWQDRTVTAFSAPPTAGKKVAPNLVVTREPVEENVTAAAHADCMLVELAKRLEDFVLQHRRDVTVAGLPAVELSFTWSTGPGALRQKQVFVVPRKRTVLTFTATAAQEDFAAAEPRFNAALASVRLPRGNV